MAGGPGALRKGIIEVCDVGVTYAGEQRLGTDSGEHAGSSLAGVGDLNGDGNNDFVTGAPNSNLGGNPDSGTTYMVLDTEAQAVTGCGASGCEVADLSNGAEIDVAPGTLSSNANLAVTGILSPSALPAAVPSGKLFLGATQLGPEGQAIPSPGATIHVPAVRGLESQVSVGESLRLYYYSPTTGWRPASPEAAGWVDSTLNGTVEANPSYPDRRAVMGVVSVLHTYAVFLNDTDGDGIRDERDCAPMDAGAFAVPQEVTGLLLGPAKTALTWNSAAPAAGSATVHDLLRGAVPELPVGNKPSETCVAPGVSGTIATDSTPPQAGHGLWYLVRGRNVCGAGTYGTASNGTPRTSTACP